MEVKKTLLGPCNHTPLTPIDANKIDVAMALFIILRQGVVLTLWVELHNWWVGQRMTLHRPQ